MNSKTNDSDSKTNDSDSKTNPNNSKRNVSGDWDSNPNDCDARSSMTNDVEGNPPPVGAVVGLVAIDGFGCKPGRVLGQPMEGTDQIMPIIVQMAMQWGIPMLPAIRRITARTVAIHDCIGSVANSVTPG